MELKFFGTISELDQYAAQLFAALTHNPRAVLGLATGSTPIGIYEKMIAMYEKAKSRLNMRLPLIWTNM